MTIPYPIDPSLPSNPSPLFSDSEAVRGDHLRANNAEIWANFTEIVESILGNASLSTDGTFAALSDLLFPSQKAVYTYINSLLPVGSSIDYSGTNIPTGWMREDGSSLLRSLYPALFSALTNGPIPVAFGTDGSLFCSLTGHGLNTGDCISFTTTGTLPGGLSPSINFYVIFATANTFYIATTYANAIAGTKISYSSIGSGSHYLTWNPWGIADATHFYLPDTQGITTEGSGQLTTNGATWGGSNYKGGLGHYKQDTSQGHRHAPLAGTGIYTQVSSGGSNTGPGAGGILYFPASTGDPVTDTVNGTPRFSSITSGPRVGKYKIIKVI